MEECKGCLFYLNEYQVCMMGIVPDIKDGCPCKTCIVKSMCNQRSRAIYNLRHNSACKEFLSYVYISRKAKDFNQVMKEFEEKGIYHSI